MKRGGTDDRAINYDHKLGRCPLKHESHSDRPHAWRLESASNLTNPGLGETAWNTSETEVQRGASSWPLAIVVNVRTGFRTFQWFAEDWWWRLLGGAVLCFFVGVCWLMLLLRLVVCLVFGGVCDWFHCPLYLFYVFAWKGQNRFFLPTRCPVLLGHQLNIDVPVCLKKKR